MCHTVIIETDKLDENPHRPSEQALCTLDLVSLISPTFSHKTCEFKEQQEKLSVRVKVVGRLQTWNESNTRRGESEVKPKEAECLDNPSIVHSKMTL